VAGESQAVSRERSNLHSSYSGTMLVLSIANRYTTFQIPSLVRTQRYLIHCAMSVAPIGQQMIVRQGRQQHNYQGQLILSIIDFFSQLLVALHTPSNLS